MASARIVRSVLVALCVAFAVVDAMLLSENLRLRNERSKMRPRSENVPVGRTVTTIRGVDLAGQYRVIEPESLAIIITFSPGCEASQANMSGWLRLEKLLTGSALRTIWISRDPIDSTAEFSRTTPVSGTVLVDPPQRVYAQLGMEAVPHTVAVDGRGMVQRAWRGRLDQEEWQEVFDFIAPKLAERAGGSRAAPRDSQ